MSAARRRASVPWAAVLLGATAACLAVGGALWAAGGAAAGRDAWLAGGALGTAYSLWTVVVGLRRGQLGVDAIAVLALVGAMAVGEDLAAAVISLMVATGQSLEGWARGRARRDLSELANRAPRGARRYEAQGIRAIDAADVAVGDRLIVSPGELVPVDGTLLDDAVLDESTLTGEPLPVARRSGDPVRSGVMNGGPAFDLLATSTAAQGTYAGIVRLVSQAEASQAPFVRLADRFALWFLGVSLGAAAVAWAAGGAARAVAVLVVATPCPLILAAPVAMVAGLSRAARRGVIIKGGAVLERLAGCTTLLIDKTGTLTTGQPTLTQVVTAEGRAPDEVLALAASLDQVSTHVLARAVVRAAADRGCRLTRPDQVEEVAGQGIRGVVGGRSVALGSASWTGFSQWPAWAKSARRRARLDGSLVVFVSVSGAPAGALVLEDPIRADAPRTVRLLRRSGIDRVVMVTGDRAEVAATIGAVIGFDEVLAERSPAEKLDAVRAERRRAPTIMLGDGVNDAPAMALADVGIAMGVRGAAASSEAADVVLTVDRLDRVGEARALAHRARAIALESVVAGMALSLGAMVPAALGLLPPVWGAILQEGIDVVVIVNALRVLRPAPVDVRLADEESELARRFQAEHQMVRAAIDEVGRAADGLGVAGAADEMARLRRVHRRLVEEVGPHEEAEEEYLYPAIGRALGGSDPTGPMSRSHVEIIHQIKRLGQLLDDIGPAGPDEDDVAELRALLYGLRALLRLHTIQEEESYLSLASEAGPVRVPRGDLAASGPPSGRPQT